MADWTDPPWPQLVAGKAWTDEKAAAAFENPIAMFEGADGAPQLADAALGPTATNAGRDWVLARQALLAAGALGSVAMLRKQSVGSASFGQVVGGGALVAASAVGDGVTVVPGSWRCLGYSAGGEAATNGHAVTLFVRIA